MARKTGTTEGYVYLIHTRVDGLSVYKIGSSIRPKTRVKGFQIPQGFAFVYEHWSDNATWLEREWQRRFASQRYRPEGPQPVHHEEWFVLSSDDVDEFCGSTGRQYYTLATPETMAVVLEAERVEQVEREIRWREQRLRDLRPPESLLDLINVDKPRPPVPEEIRAEEDRLRREIMEFRRTITPPPEPERLDLRRLIDV